MQSCCSRSPNCCCWMNLRTISISDPSSGWNDFCERRPRLFIVVSHDRIFLDRVVQAAFLKSPTSRVLDYRGNYTAYLRERRTDGTPGKGMAPAAGLDCQSGRIRPTKHRRTKDQAGPITAQNARAGSAHRKTAIGIHQIKFNFLPSGRGSRFSASRLVLHGLRHSTDKGFSASLSNGGRAGRFRRKRGRQDDATEDAHGAVSPLSGRSTGARTQGGLLRPAAADLQKDSTVFDEIRALDSTASDGELRSYLAQFLFSGEDVFNQFAT